MPQQRQSRSAQQALETKIQHINALPSSEFASTYLPPDWSTWTSPRTQELYNLTLQSPAELSSDQFQACYDLIEQTSGDDYRNSGAGWNEVAKKEEMKNPGLRYILITQPSSTTILGFLSFLPCFEASLPVLYIYEIHLSSTLRSTGLGTHIITNLTKPVARNLGVLDKIMLTCFKRNDAAWRFYTKLGFATDGSSPEDRTLRGGRVVTSDYVILSWRIGGGP